MFAWVAFSSELSVFSKEEISWSVAVLVSVSLCDGSSCYEWCCDVSTVLATGFSVGGLSSSSFNTMPLIIDHL